MNSEINLFKKIKNKKSIHYLLLLCYLFIHALLIAYLFIFYYLFYLDLACYIRIEELEFKWTDKQFSGNVPTNWLYSLNSVFFLLLTISFFRRPKCDENISYCANNNAEAVSKLEKWKSGLCSYCKSSNVQKEDLYNICKAAKDSLGYKR